ncbi:MULTISPECIES: hypothetical protein [Xenorhabdus]|uniref:hypothetical protein n=1 Tax=Xenorhabdus TaxID=626 RepID=UPI001E5E0E07|nr:hypothetical protein [Xenorhabdus sp. PB30.3]MCC8379035.1 hypothetical protein [Xenorhabdus sp. PB30.3]
MAQLTVVPNKSNVFKDQPFSVIVTITGEININDQIRVNATQLTGVKLLSTLPGNVSGGNFTQTLIFQADGTSSNCSILFSANTPDHLKTEAQYQVIDNPKLDADSCKLSLSKSYLVDLAPVDTTATPGSNNPFVIASINPTVNKNPIPNYDIHILTKSHVRIYTQDKVEIKPYKTINPSNGYLYYEYVIPKTSVDPVVLRIYATKHLNDFVSLETQFGNYFYDSLQVLFISTNPTRISQTLDAPKIKEASNGNLTRPDNQDSQFTFEVLGSIKITSGSYLIGFVTDDLSNPYNHQLCYGKIDIEENGYYKFPANYTDMHDGVNYISYITINNNNQPEGSIGREIDYNSNGNNDPDSTGGVMVPPEIYDQYDDYINADTPINRDSIGNTGLNIKMLHDEHKSAITVGIGDVITIKAYISYCDDESNSKRPNPVIITGEPINSADIIDNYYTMTIPADKLIDYKTSPKASEGKITIEYSRLTQNKRSIPSVRSFDTSKPY